MIQQLGGDDCIAIKPRSSNIFVQNATCRGGNGMAIGSLGQYLEDNTVENVVVDDVKVSRMLVERNKEATKPEPDHPMERRHAWLGADQNVGWSVGSTGPFGERVL